MLKRHFPELEGLRGFLAILVLSTHMAIAIADSERYAWAAIGSMDVFFCLSGFLIGRNFILRYDGKISSSYFVNRMLRIWPIYFIAWPFAALVTVSVGAWYFDGQWQPLHTPSGPGQVLPGVFLQFVEEHLRGMRFEYLQLFRHSWSLALEEQFYLLAPFVMLAFSRARTRLIIAVGLLATVLSILVPYYGVGRGTFLARNAGFLYGLILALLEHRAVEGDPWATRLFRTSVAQSLFFASVLLTMPFVFGSYGAWQSPENVYYRVLANSIFNPYITFPCIGVALIGIVATTNGDTRWGAIFRTPMFQVTGRMSYSIYLLHVPIVFAVAPALLRALNLNEIWLVGAAPALVFAVSYVAHRYIELPFLRAKTYSTPLGKPPLLKVTAAAG